MADAKSKALTFGTVSGTGHHVVAGLVLSFHLPEDATDDYCAQLVSETRIRKPSGRATWVQRSRSNHYFDCEAMAYAAGRLLNVQRIPEASYNGTSDPSDKAARATHERADAPRANDNERRRGPTLEM